MSVCIVNVWVECEGGEKWVPTKDLLVADKQTYIGLLKCYLYGAKGNIPFQPHITGLYLYNK